MDSLFSFMINSSYHSMGKHGPLSKSEKSSVDVNVDSRIFPITTHEENLEGLKTTLVCPVLIARSVMGTACEGFLKQCEGKFEQREVPG